MLDLVSYVGPSFVFSSSFRMLDLGPGSRKGAAQPIAIMIVVIVIAILIRYNNNITN